MNLRHYLLKSSQNGKKKSYFIIYKIMAASESNPELDPELLRALEEAMTDPAAEEAILSATETPTDSIETIPDMETGQESLNEATMEAARAVSAARAARAAARGEIKVAEPRKSTIAPPVEGILAGAAHFRIPRAGACIFLMLDISTLPTGPEERKAIVRELELLNGNSDYHLEKIGDWLQIVGSEERASSDLALTQKSLRKVWPASKSIMGSGSVEHDDDVSFHVNVGSSAQSWAENPTGHYMTPELDAKRRRPEEREFTHCEISTDDPTPEGLIPILDAIPKITKRLGGPDKYIGNTKQRAALKAALQSGATRLITVKGQRGIGKSRIQDEVIAELKLNEVSCSFDASDRNVAGKGLVTMANQIATAIREMKLGLDDLDLMKFLSTNPTPAQQVEYTQEHAAEVAEMCSGALQVITYMKDENTLFRLEDLHHADTFSQNHLKKVVRDFLEYTEKGKVLTSLRPEDFLEPELQEQLERSVQGFYGPESYTEIELSTLDFTENDAETGNELSYEYVLHSLPAELRGCLIGSWHRELAKASGGNPFVMSYFINTIFSDEANYSVTGENVITVKDQVLQEIKDIDPAKPDALNTHFQQRLGRLPEAAQKLVQVIALAGGRLLDSQLSRIAFDLCGSVAMGERIKAQLIKGRYLIGEPENAPNQWSMENELFTALANASMKDKTERKNTLEFLDQRFEDDPNLSTDAKFNIKQELAMSKRSDEAAEFWQGYSSIAKAALEDAKQRNDYRDGLTRAKRIIGTRVLEKDKISVVGGVPAVNSILEVLTLIDPEDFATVLIGVPEELIKLSVNSAFAVARNGIYLAQFKEAGLVLETLSAISEKHPTLVSKSDLLILQFEHAYQSRDRDKMTALLADLKDNAKISDITKRGAEIKLAYNKNDFPGLKKLYDDSSTLLEESHSKHQTAHRTPSPEAAEIERIATLMSPFIELQSKVKHRKYGFTLDDDIDHVSAALSDDQFQEAEALLATAEKMLKDSDKYPRLYDAYSLLNITAIRAELQIYLGLDDKADTQLREAWRVADQTGVPETAVRSAKNLGDFRVNRGDVKEGLAAYRQQGKISMAGLNEKELSSWVMRIQKIRATNLEAVQEWRTGLPEGAKDNLKRKFEADLAEAFAEFLELSRIANQNEDILSPEAAYYILGHFGVLLQIAKDLNITIPKEIFGSPLIGKSNLKGAKDFAKGMTDYGLKTIQTKYGPKPETEIKAAGFRHLDHLYEVAEARLEAQRRAREAAGEAAPE